MFTEAKKRAFRRARRRAETAGGALYRGRWHSANALGLNDASAVARRGSATGRERSRAQPGWTAQPRLRVRNYNVGGVTTDVYALLHRWLTRDCTDDVVILQELHWGCGRQDGNWEIPRWSVIITADARNRFSGIGVFISKRVAPGDSLSFHTWIPGRLLHVRCHTDRLTLDIIVEAINMSGRTASIVEWLRRVVISGTS